MSCMAVLSAFFVCLSGGICRYQPPRRQAGVEASNRHTNRFLLLKTVTSSNMLSGWKSDVAAVCFIVICLSDTTALISGVTPADIVLSI